MLKELRLKNFTVFSDTAFSFVSGLNIITGPGGSGKSHLLKAVYALVRASSSCHKNQIERFNLILRYRCKNGLLECLRAHSLDSLVRIPHQRRSRCSVAVKFDDERQDFDFSFCSVSEAFTFKKYPLELIRHSPFFIPNREVLSIVPVVVTADVRDPQDGILRNYFDFTCISLCRAFLNPAGADASLNADFIKLAGLIHEAIGGRLVFDEARVPFFKTAEKRRAKGLDNSKLIEISMVGDGIKKMALLAYLLLNRYIEEQGFLIIDEPEASLEPELMCVLAKVLVELSLHHKIQIFLATDSIFFISELNALVNVRQPDLATRYILLRPTSKGTVVSAANSCDVLNDYPAFNEVMLKTEEYLKENAKTSKRIYHESSC